MEPRSAYSKEELIQIRKDLIAENKALREELKIANEKQVAAKPREHQNWNEYCHDGDHVGEQYLCPRCNSFLDESENYCRECGQKLDWS